MTSVPVTGTTNGGGGGGGSSRWSPTPEQVMLLEGMYKGGLKNPSATQIQQITARLAIYGKIQGKNVFYWFQNHKARDRQKLRKKLMALYQQHQLFPPQDHPFLPLHQVGGVEDASSCRTNIVNNYQTCNLMCDCGVMSMMMMDNNHGTSSYSTRVPPKTLQLFPVTTTTEGEDH